jgi:hypothetical protein
MNILFIAFLNSIFWLIHRKIPLKEVINKENILSLNCGKIYNILKNLVQKMFNNYFEVFLICFLKNIHAHVVRSVKKLVHLCQHGPYVYCQGKASV